MSHFGKVHDDGDEGEGLRGQRIGMLKRVNHKTYIVVEGKEAEEKYFNNGNLGIPPVYRENDIVEYEKRGKHAAIVNRYIGRTP